MFCMHRLEAFERKNLVSDPDELKKIAQNIEERIYSGSTSLVNYQFITPMILLSKYCFPLLVFQRMNCSLYGDCPAFFTAVQMLIVAW